MNKTRRYRNPSLSTLQKVLLLLVLTLEHENGLFGRLRIIPVVECFVTLPTGNSNQHGVRQVVQKRMQFCDDKLLTLSQNARKNCVMVSPCSAMWTRNNHSPLQRRRRRRLDDTRLHSAAVVVSGFAIDRAVALISVSATAKLLSSIALGAAFAKKPGVLDPSAISALSRLTYWIFQPAFLLCSVSKTFYNASVGGPNALPGSILALMPLTALLQCALGALTGTLLTKIVPLKGGEDEAANVRMCTAFANSGPLPLIFSDALFSATRPAVFAQVASCISFYLLVWSPLFWSFGKIILGTYNDDDDDKGAIATNGESPKRSAFSPKIRRVGKEIKKLLSPPVIGSILGIVIGCNPLLRNLAFGAPGSASSSVPLLSPLFGALQTLGTAYLPAALLVLAGSLVGGGGGSKEKQQQQPQSQQSSSATSFPSSSLQSSRSVVPSSSSVNSDAPVDSSSAAPSLTSLACIAVSRFVMAPLLSFGLLTVLARIGWLGAVGSRARAIITFVILMEGSMPPAQNSVILLQLANRRERSKELAQLLTLLYALAVVPVTFLLSASLSVSGILAFQ